MLTFLFEHFLTMYLNVTLLVDDGSLFWIIISDDISSYRSSSLSAVELREEEVDI